MTLQWPRRKLLSKQVCQDMKSYLSLLSKKHILCNEWPLVFSWKIGLKKLFISQIYSIYFWHATLPIAESNLFFLSPVVKIVTSFCQLPSTCLLPPTVVHILFFSHLGQTEKLSPNASPSPAQEARGGSPDSISSVGSSSVASRNSHLQPAPAPHMPPYHTPQSPAHLQSNSHIPSPRQTTPMVQGNHPPHISQPPQPIMQEAVSHQMGYHGLQTQPRPLYQGQVSHPGKQTCLDLFLSVFKCGGTLSHTEISDPSSYPGWGCLHFLLHWYLLERHESNCSPSSHW